MMFTVDPRSFSYRKKNSNAGSAVPELDLPLTAARFQNHKGLPVVPVIVGPTGVGKTAVALAIGERCPIAVISADSRQIYRSLDIGTAKPLPDERGNTRHFGFDMVEPGQRYSAGQYARQVRDWLDHVESDVQPVIVGGTGFYVRALTEGIFQEPPMPEEVRFRLRSWFDQVDDVESWANALDSEYVPGGRQRAIRAVEIALLTGRPLSWWQRNSPGTPVVDPWYIRLTLSRKALYERIDVRVSRMLDQGWIEEVRALLDGGVAEDAPGLDAVGYREVVEYIRGGISRVEMERLISQRTRQYAKRQETWFRHQLGTGPVLTVDASNPVDELARSIVSAWRKEYECESG